jgi:hypothetical protein
MTIPEYDKCDLDAENARLLAELAAAREELHGISCRHESSIRLMRNQNEELIKMLAKRPTPTLLVDKSDSAELAKLRALLRALICAVDKMKPGTASVWEECWRSSGMDMPSFLAAGRGEGEK